MLFLARSDFRGSGWSPPAATPQCEKPRRKSKHEPRKSGEAGWLLGFDPIFVATTMHAARSNRARYVVPSSQSNCPLALTRCMGPAKHSQHYSSGAMMVRLSMGLPG
jgi:hypothetical protein